MTEITKYESDRRVCVDLAKAKAERHGEGAWGFEYRGQLVQVSAKEQPNGEIRVHTQPVKNKGAK